jgi:hypothetical protein
VGRLIARIATKQLGVISLEQLLDLGRSRGEVRGIVRRGFLIPLHRGVYIVGHRSLVPRSYLIAALLAAGSDAFLSHRTAAAVNGLRAINTRRIELTIPGANGSHRAGLVVHRTRTPPHPSEIRMRDGLRVSSVPRMLVELAPRESDKELDRLITVAARKRRLDVTEMESTLVRHSRRPGLAKLKRALAAYRPKPEHKSGFEIAFDEWLAKHPEIPEPRRDVHFDNRWELDCYWPERRFAVELDTRDYHGAAADFDRDRSKDIYLKRHGIDHIRITDTRFQEDKAGIRDDLHHFLGIRKNPPKEA